MNSKFPYQEIVPVRGKFCLDLELIYHSFPFRAGFSQRVSFLIKNLVYITIEIANPLYISQFGIYRHRNRRGQKIISTQNYNVWIAHWIISLLPKLPSRKLELWFVVWSSVLLRLLCTSIYLPYGHVWSTVVMSGLVLLVDTWNCWIRYKNGYAGLLFFHLLPVLNLCLIVKM